MLDMHRSEPSASPSFLEDPLAEGFLRGFSCPQEPFDAAFLECVVVGRARAAACLFLERYRSQLERQAPGIAEVLERWSGDGIASTAAWGPAWGELYRIVRSDPVPSLDAAAPLSLWLGASGMPGEWRTTLERPARLCWGRWLLPEASWLAVESDGSSAWIQTRSDTSMRECRFHLERGEWEGEGADLLPQFGTRREKISLLPARALRGDTLDFLRPMAVAEIAPAMADTFQDTLVFLYTHAAPYLPWVMRLLREVIVLDPDPALIRSGSSGDQPGLIHISFTSDPASLAESLVHEAAHQYLDVLTWLGPVDDGTDTNLYYSPMKKEPRSLYRIALTYHAFANVILFYRSCRASGAPDSDYFDRWERDLIPKLEQLEGPLRGNPALTPIGRALCEPLIQRLR